MLDPKEEQQYTELRRLAQKLHIPIPEVFLTLEVFDKDGKLIQRHRQRSHSWVRNAYNLLFCNLAGKDADDTTFEAGKLSMKDTVAAVYHGNYPPYIVPGTGDSADAVGKAYLAAASIDTSGILVGYGTTAESFEDYVIANLIAEGTTDDGLHLSYVESEATVITYADTTLTATLIRYFNNNEATQSVDVKEVCIVANAYLVSASKKFVMSRDVLASTVTVPVTGQLKVTYTIQLTYPA